MATKAYILLKTKVGSSRAVVDQLRGTEGVVEADAVNGAYDAIAVVNGPALNAVGDLGHHPIPAIDGIDCTMKCISDNSNN